MRSNGPYKERTSFCVCVEGRLQNNEICKDVLLTFGDFLNMYANKTAGQSLDF